MIVNLTQHAATPEQKAQGVVDLPEEKAARLRGLLTFEEPPSEDLILERARAVAALAKEEGAKDAMIGGAPFFMAALAEALKAEGVEPLFAFSKRVAVERVLPDGGVEKRMVFRHKGFVPYVR